MPLKRTAMGKQKSTATRPTGQGSSSIFVSNEAMEKYENMRNRSFATERGWKLSDFGAMRPNIEGLDENWLDLLGQLGLVGLLEFHQGYIPELVREFYANSTNWSTDDGSEFLETTVRGQQIRLTPDTFVKMFGLIRDYNAEQVSSEVIDENLLKDGAPREKMVVKVGWLKPDYITLSKSICANLMPIMHDKEFDREKMRVMWAIAEGCHVNAPRIMLLQIINAITTKHRRTSSPFPGIITEIIRNAGVSTAGHEMGKQRIPGLIDRSTVRKALNTIRPQEAQEAEESSEEEEDESEGQAGNMISLGRKMDALELRMRKNEELTESGHMKIDALDTRMARVDEIMERGYRMIEEMYRAARQRDPSFFSSDQPGPSS